jgi:hypothetical protein
MYSSGETGISHLKKHDSAETVEIVEGLEVEVLWGGLRNQNQETERKLICSNTNYKGARSGVVVKALRYKLEGRRFVSRLCCWIFSFP